MMPIRKTASSWRETPAYSVEKYKLIGNTYDIAWLTERVDTLEGKVDILLDTIARQADQIHDLEQELKEVI